MTSHKREYFDFQKAKDFNAKCLYPLKQTLILHTDIKLIPMLYSTLSNPKQRIYFS